MIVQTTTLSFKTELLSGVHDFSSDTFKLSLYTSDADIDENTLVYSSSEEVVGTGYVAGGATLSTSVSSDGIYGTSYVEISDVTFSAAEFVTRGGLIYNSSKSNASVAVLNFGIDITKSGTDLVVTFGSALNDNSVIAIK